MTVFVTGHRGRVGRCLVLKGYKPLPCDVTDLGSIRNAIRENFVKETDTIVHCAAITDVDACEGSLYSEAIEVNILGTTNVRTVFKGQIIYLSTDYVFDGRDGPYSEEATPNPICHYGETKLFGEEAILEADYDRDVILRTTVLYGGWKNDFVSSILKQLKDNEIFRVTGQLLGSPTYVPHLVEGIQRLVRLKSPPKIVNITGSDIISRWVFACMIAKAFGYPIHNVLLTMEGHMGSAPRPRLGGLKISFARALDIPIYSVKEGLDKMAGDRANAYRR
jgi:dTDP-4-dehydrorhamnose reductase